MHLLIYLKKACIIEEYVAITYAVVYLDNPYIIDSLDNQLKLRYRRSARYNHEDKMRLMIGQDNSSLQVSIFDEIIDNETSKLFLDKLQELLNGEFVDFDGELRFQEEWLDEPIKVSNLSMGSKSLAIILKLIKSGWIREKGILILDEPEIHLHPKWQLYFAEILVMMQEKLKLHILINSHSPYFINAIEIYSAKYKIADCCKYYLATLNNEKKAVFNDVTTDIDKIYVKLAQPLLDLEDELL